MLVCDVKKSPKYEATILIVRGLVVRIVACSPVPNLRQTEVVFDKRQNAAEVVDMRPDLFLQVPSLVHCPEANFDWGTARRRPRLHRRFDPWVHDGRGAGPGFSQVYPIIGIVCAVATQDSAQVSRHRRVLGLDVGARRIGVAVSDPLGITAQGLETIQRKNKRFDLEQLGKVVREYEVSEIVVGYPLRMSGAEGVQADKMQMFAEELRQRFQVQVHLWDERLTSAQANRVLRETEMSIRRRAEVVDQMAAVLILQNWMEARRG